MASPSQASLLLQKQLKDLCKHPVDGFSAGLLDETNLFDWSNVIYCEGGFFNAIMSFPSDYPNSPPTVRFTSEVWHPNVYADGKVCISILHPPGDDPNGYELASERWSPVHTVESIVLSIISMLSSPNDESPANVEAAKEWRDRRDDFKKKVSRCAFQGQGESALLYSSPSHMRILVEQVAWGRSGDDSQNSFGLQNSNRIYISNQFQKCEIAIPLRKVNIPHVQKLRDMQRCSGKSQDVRLEAIAPVATPPVSSFEVILV
ncbi:hypothetical protein SASPL_139034 [Salvia splendens]|uniref:E2 ubiquitin-conjugating enzyme n=1 Tax=Salvia splendens TaxID=180675 RepID=A0A8X8WXN5_SALSN|nr:hypothetical protein SASPL_139034 [Salvia splendens]